MRNKVKLVRGVGVNDSNTPVTLRKLGKQAWMCPAYSAWRSMLNRCYGVSFLDKNPTYRDVIVCNEWLLFSKFRDWWVLNYVDGFELDKDIIGSGLIYGPDDCIYVPGWINSFTIDRAADRGDYPIGVSIRKDSGLFVAQCGNRKIKNGREHLGYFETAEGAHSAWRSRKLEMAMESRGEMDEIDARIYPAIIEIIENSR